MPGIDWTTVISAATVATGVGTVVPACLTLVWRMVDRERAAWIVFDGQSHWREGGTQRARDEVKDALARPNADEVIRALAVLRGEHILRVAEALQTTVRGLPSPGCQF